MEHTEVVGRLQRSEEISREPERLGQREGALFESRLQGDSLGPALRVNGGGPVRSAFRH